MDADDIGDLCDMVNGDDKDGDGVVDADDNCPDELMNQVNTDGDNKGNACDDDDDNGSKDDKDCAPVDPLVAPNAGETCNDGIDNSSNSKVDTDELNICNDQFNCESHMVDEAKFVFCEAGQTWNQAKDHCKAQGGHLADQSIAAESTRGDVKRKFMELLDRLWFNKRMKDVIGSGKGAPWVTGMPGTTNQPSD